MILCNNAISAVQSLAIEPVIFVTNIAVHHA